MKDQDVLVIGGGSGIGLGVAERLLQLGATVTIAGRSEERLAAAAAALGAPPGLRTVRVDVTSEEQVRAAVAGGADHVVVTAADATRAYAPVGEFDLADAQRVLAVKLLGPWLVAKHAAARLPGHGSITFTSGIAAYRPGPGSSMIATANAALEGLARSLALELAPVRVNVVSPGWVDTPIWDALAGPVKGERLAAMAQRLPAGRVGRPDDIARAVTALIDNPFVTGTVMHVDGGHRLV